MFWFAGITTAIHWSVTTILALFYALIDKYSLFENAKISVDRVHFIYTVTYLIML